VGSTPPALVVRAMRPFTAHKARASLAVCRKATPAQATLYRLASSTQ
jgi:hypothetical protein